MTQLKHFNRIWQLSLLSFIIAAFTGFLYRYGMFWPLPEGISFANIRHSHSHLMFFNWITPPIMVWMVGLIVRPETVSLERKFAWCLYTMLGLGFLSYPFFLLYGYHSVAIGPANLPLAAIISGLVMITWYWFTWLYFSHRKKSVSSLSAILADAALIALLISSLGAWGVSIFQFSNLDSPLISSALTHFFLGVFTEGWVLLGVFAVVWQKAGEPEIKLQKGWLWIPLLFGSMLIFPFSLNRAIITPAMHLTANIGLLLIAVSLSLHIWLLLKQNLLRGFLWATVAGLVILKILFQIIAVLPAGIWPGEHGLRVLYLHILLLGIASFVIVELFHAGRNRIAKVCFVLAVIVVLITLLMISGYWPPNLVLPDIYRWVMAAALLPVIPAVWLFLSTFKRKCTLQADIENTDSRL